MVRFLALNTSSITLVPATIIAVRVTLGSSNPTEIVAPTILASACATVVAVTAARALERLPILRVVQPPPPALLRPLSGSGTLALVSELMKTHGPDSFVGGLASTIYGSTETTFYVLAVYFGAVGIRRTRHAVVAGLLGDVAGIAAALLFCRLLF